MNISDDLLILTFQVLIIKLEILRVVWGEERINLYFLIKILLYSCWCFEHLENDVEISFIFVLTKFWLGDDGIFKKYFD